MTETPSSAMKKHDAIANAPSRDCQRANDILRGTQRLLRSLDFQSLSEVGLGNGRRADILAISPSGQIWIVEIKSSIADFRSDHKWQEYREYCDAMLFAVAPDFPNEMLPSDTGVILSDAYGGEITRQPPSHPLNAARRKALTLSMARLASARLLARLDPAITLDSSER